MHCAMSGSSHSEALRIPADHPSLPGHFPGRPIVPGVVLLDRVAAALERWRSRRVAGFPQVKFVQSLMPGEDAELILDGDGGSFRFRIIRAAQTIASGSIEAA
jgi:3-hydroxymyristoyl/3-hydroxydecanoyl-(acyl carrier protein) dehydratase